MKIYDDALNKEYEDQLTQFMCSGDFPFYLNANTSLEVENGTFKTELTKDDLQFTHTFVKFAGVPNSGLTTLIQPLAEKINELIGGNNTLLRCKANLNVQSLKFTKDEYYIPHVDFVMDNLTTAIYYVNDCDGDTLFFDKDLNVVDKASPKKGRIVIFSGDQIHAGQPPKDSNYRVLINFNFTKVTLN